MKKTTALLLAVLLLLAAPAGCKNNGNTPNDSTSSDSGDVIDPNTPIGTVNTPGPVVEPVKYRIMTFGDGVFSGYNTIDILAAFAKADGILIETIPVSYDTRNLTSTYSLYELYNFDSTKADAKLLGIKDTGNANMIKYNLTSDSEPIDLFLMEVSPDRGVGLSSARGRILTALKDIDSRYSANNPSGKFVFVSAPAFKEGFAQRDPESMKKWGLSTVSDFTPEKHNSLIKKHAQEMASSVKTPYEIAQAGDAFLTYYSEYYSKTGIDLHTEDLRTLNVSGSYFMAALLYGQIFGKSPAKIPVNAFLSADEAETLRNIAHEIVFGTSPDSVVRDYGFVTVKEDTAIKPEYAHEVYPEYYDILMTTVYAYENRGLWLQYDQMKLDSVTKTFARRTIQDAYPECATPEKNLYLDCSSFVRALFLNVFNYTFNGANRTKQLLQLEENCVFHYQGDSTPGSKLTNISQKTNGTTQHGYIDGKPVTDDEARQAFLQILQPGDVIVLGDYQDGGHTIFYAGNGLVIHSASRRLGGGNTDYSTDRKADNLEMSPGGILRDDLEVFTHYWGRAYRYLFDAKYDCKILRPCMSDITPTEEAISRHENLQNIVAYKATSVPEGNTVNAGQNVTVTFTVENRGNENKHITITDRLPAELIYRSGGVYDQNKYTVTFEAVIKANSVATLSYVVDVAPDTEAGKVIYSDAEICGVRLTKTPIRVGNTLTAEQQASIKDLTSASAAKSKTDLDLVLSLYKDGFGFTLPFTDKETLYTDIFEELEGGNAIIMASAPGESYYMLANPLFGGQNLSTDGGLTRFDRTQYLFCHNFMPGDILLINESLGTDKIELWVYTGNETFVTIQNGKQKTLTGGAALHLREWALGCVAFCVVRPSLIF